MKTPRPAYPPKLMGGGRVPPAPRIDAYDSKHLVGRCLTTLIHIKDD